jgi:hypothetical protein
MRKLSLYRVSQTKVQGMTPTILRPTFLWIEEFYLLTVLCNSVMGTYLAARLAHLYITLHVSWQLYMIQENLANF